MKMYKKVLDLICLFLGTFILFPLPCSGEKLFPNVNIPKFPAPQRPKDYEPPDWKNYPWHPGGHPELFDVNQPDAAEKIMWITKDNFDSGYTYDMISYVVVEDKYGQVKITGGGRTTIYLYAPDFKDLLSYHEGKVKAGDMEFPDLMWTKNPPALRGQSYLTYKYVETPAVKKEQERWIYFPNLRKARRLAAGAESDSLGGTDFTVDDVGQRDVWEEDYAFIGEDILEPSDHTLYSYMPKNPIVTQDWKEFPPYRPKNGFDCWVILGVNTKPTYYISKRILWIDKKELLIVREEQYDRNGELWKILETGWLDKKKKYASREPDIHYWSRVLWHSWDIKNNHRSTNLYFDVRYDGDSFLGWKGEETPSMSFFDVKKLEREEWARPVVDLSAPKRIDELVPRPKLLTGEEMRFIQYRNIKKVE